MTTRRTFIKSASFLSTALFIDPNELMNKRSLIGLQLYTVRDAMEKDPASALARVAQIGYNTVEAATYTGTQKFYGLAPSDFARLLHQNGLLMPSAHYRLGEVLEKGEIVKGTMLHGWDKAVDDASEAGLKYMVCAWLHEDERKGLDHYKFIADQLNIAGERCKKNGIQMCYHNHDFEFIKQGDTYPYDILLASDKDRVKMEIDLYWVSKAGLDAVTLINQHPGRFPLCHLKDMDSSPAHGFTEVGNGVINFKKILKHTKNAGFKYIYVEQDQTPGSPFDSITKSFSYVRKHLKRYMPGDMS